MVDRAKLKDNRGAERTESLFVETIRKCTAKKYEPLYSLRNYDNKGHPSAYAIYMDSPDEYAAAIELVGSMGHWRKLCSLDWFVNGKPIVQFEGLNQWREDMRQRDESLGKKVLLEQAKKGNVTAAKTLYSEKKKGGIEKSKPKSRKEEELDNAISKIGR